MRHVPVRNTTVGFLLMHVLILLCTWLFDLSLDEPPIDWDASPMSEEHTNLQKSAKWSLP